MKEGPALRPLIGAMPTEEEIRKSLEETHQYERPTKAPGAVSYIKLFLTICLSAPVAVYLSALVLSSMAPGNIPTPSAEPSPHPVQPAAEAPSSANQELLAAVTALEKSNESIAAAISAQTAALEKIAGQLVEASKAGLTAPAGEAPKPAITVQGPQVIVVKVPVNEPFDLAYEKNKILELCGVDLDDPISGPAQFDKVGSAEALREVIHSFDAILASAKTNKDVSAFIKGNAQAGRKYAIERLKKLK